MKAGNLKKAMALAISAIMVFALYACSGSENPGGSNAPSNSSGSSNSNGNGGGGQNSQGSSSQNPSESSNPLPPVVPIYDPPITIKIGGVASVQADSTDADLYTNNWFTLYKECGINMEYMWIVPAAQQDTKMSTAIASGSYPDIFTVKTTQYVTYATTGVIADITDLYNDMITDNGREYLDSDAGAGLRSALVGGRLYGMPTLGNPYDNMLVLFLRGDWLNKLGLPMPTTVDEVFNIAKAFTEQDPDGNGRNDTYGLALDGSSVFSYNSGIQAFCEMFGAAPGFWDTKFTFVKNWDGDGLVWGGMHPGMKPALQMLQDMHKAGYLRSDMGVMNGEDVGTDIKAGKVGMWFMPIWGNMGGTRSLLTTNPDSDADIVTVPLPGVDANNPGRALKPTAIQDYFCVSSKCEYPDVLMNLFTLSVDKLMFPQSPEEYDHFSEWKSSLFCGLNPLKNVDNYNRLRPAVENRDPSGLFSEEQKSNYASIIYTLDWTGRRDDEEYLTGLSLYKVFVDPQGSSAAMDMVIKDSRRMNDLMYTDALTSNMIKKFATLDKLVKETIIKIIYGDPVSNWDAMLDNWWSLGGDIVTEEANDWYNANK